MSTTGRTPSAAPPAATSAEAPERAPGETGQLEHPGGQPQSRAAALLVRMTYHEERLRDRLLGLMLHLIPSNVTPDHLTILRVALAAGGALMWASGAPLRPVLWVLALAAWTDFVDGPLARRRGGGSAAGARLDQVADALLAGSLGVMALAHGLLGRHLVLAMVVAQALSVFAGLIRRAGLVERPTTLARLQFVLVTTGFWVALMGASLRHAPLVTVGRGLMYAEAAIAFLLGVLRLVGWYPHRPI